MNSYNLTYFECENQPENGTFQKWTVLSRMPERLAAFKFITINVNLDKYISTFDFVYTITFVCPNWRP